MVITHRKCAFKMLSGLKFGNYLAKLSSFEIPYVTIKGIPTVGVGDPVYNLRAFELLSILLNVISL